MGRLMRVVVFAGLILAVMGSPALAAEEIDDDGDPTGVSLPDHPADILDVEVIRDPNGGLAVWVDRNSSERVFSAAVQIFLLDADGNPVYFAFWQDHGFVPGSDEGEITGGIQDGVTGELLPRDFLGLEWEEDGSRVCFFFPPTVANDVDQVQAESLARVTPAQLRGRDFSDRSAVPPVPAADDEPEPVAEEEPAEEPSEEVPPPAAAEEEPAPAQNGSSLPLILAAAVVLLGLLGWLWWRAGSTSR